MENYDANRLAAGSEAAAKLLEDNAGYTESDTDRLTAEISRPEASIQRKTERMHDFSFHELEMEISDDYRSIPVSANRNRKFITPRRI